MVTPSGRFGCSSSKFPQQSYQGLFPADSEIRVGVNGARNLPDGDKYDVDLHPRANNFAPNESERLSISLVLLFTKDQNTRGNSSGDCNGKEIKAVNWSSVNYDGNMGRGPMTFTSDVSLPKDDK